MNEKEKKLKDIIDNSKNIVFFGGAGVSTASGIPDFRSADGLYNETLNMNLSPEQLVSHTFYERYPEEFFEYYKDKLVYPEAKPNSCHKALAKLEKEGKVKAVVTQNIDGLHQEAGSENVLELHGTVHKNYCQHCRKEFDLDYVLNSNGAPKCDVCGGPVRPDVVLYEEALDQETLAESIKAISEADTLIVGGTSLVVYPAAGLINYFNGDNLVLINKSETPYDDYATLAINDDIAKVFEDVVDLD